MYSPANIVYLGCYFLEPLFRLLGTTIGVRQQYPPVFGTGIFTHLFQRYTWTLEDHNMHEAMPQQQPVHRSFLSLIAAETRQHSQQLQDRAAAAQRTRNHYLTRDKV